MGRMFGGSGFKQISQKQEKKEEKQKKSSRNFYINLLFGMFGLSARFISFLFILK